MGIQTNIKKSIVGILLTISFIILPENIIGQNSISTNDNSYIVNSNGKNKVHYKNNGNEFKIESDGEIQISADDTDIISISRGGFIEIKKSSFGNKRRILIESDGGQKLIRKYYVGGKQKNYDPEGKRWLAEILPEVVRSTKIGAKSRVEKFYRKGGSKAVLNEINKIDSDYVKEHYFTLLLTKNLSTSDLVLAIETASNQLKSDHYLATLLRNNQKIFLDNDKTITAYIVASGNLESDHYLAQVLKTVIEDNTISDSQMSRLMDITKEIKSDHYLAQILNGIMDHRDLNEKNVNKIIVSSGQIKSDHYKAQVLRKALKQKNLSKSAYNSFFSSIGNIKSDHYLAEIAGDFITNDLDKESLNSLLTIIEDNMNSDHYVSDIFKKIAKKSNLSEDILIQVLNVAGASIKSDHYLSSTLVDFSGIVNSSSDKVKTAYRNAAKNMNSDTYYGKALKALN